MARKQKLFSYAEGLIKKNIKLILIHINEAHSTKWKIGLKNHPEPQYSFQDRFNRTVDFVKNHNPPYDVYIDNWKNDYDNKYATWPDKYFQVNKNLQIIAKSEYGSCGKLDGVILKDVTVICNEILNNC